MRILAIETSCDETAAAIVEDGEKILSNVIRSQIKQHAPHGGVFPQIAAKAHLDAIMPVIELALQEASLSLLQIDAIAVAHTPGLLGSLMVGVETAKTLAYATGIPLIGVNHIEAHLYAAIMHSKQRDFPALGLILSGGHSMLVKIDGIGSYSLLGNTMDDALGEAYDKVARVMGLAYPGGAALEKLALEGDPMAFPFKAGSSKTNPYALSFSGLKTQVFYAIRDNPHYNRADIAASFQRAAISDLVKKSKAAILAYDLKALYLGGGVAQNQTLQNTLKEALSTPLYAPPAILCSDNAAMIAGLAFHKKESSFELAAQPTGNFSLFF